MESQAIPETQDDLGPTLSVPFLSFVRITDDIRLWGAFSMFVGIIQLIALILDRRWPRWTAAFLMSWFPSVIIVSIVANPPVTETLAPYLGWAGINLYSTFRHTRRLA